MLFEISFQAVSQHLDVLEPLKEAPLWMQSRKNRLEERYERLDAVRGKLSDST